MSFVAHIQSCKYANAMGKTLETNFEYNAVQKNTN